MTVMNRYITLKHHILSRHKPKNTCPWCGEKMTNWTDCRSAVGDPAAKPPVPQHPD
jgi:hypothetical protein